MSDTSDKCMDRLALGRCGKPTLPGMVVCIEHATKEAMAVYMRMTAERLNTLTECALEAERLLESQVVDARRLAIDSLRVGLRSLR